MTLYQDIGSVALGAAIDELADRHEMSGEPRNAVGAQWKGRDPDAHAIDDSRQPRRTMQAGTALEDQRLHAPPGEGRQRAGQASVGGQNLRSGRLESPGSRRLRLDVSRR